MRRVLVSVALGALGLLLAASPALAAGGDYLALGDSVAFGYQLAHDRASATAFAGYPERLGAMLDLTVTNASCPGEASGGFLSLAGLDNGCRAYRAAFPLHTSYGGTQIDFATQFLREHPSTRLVTIDLGANDLFALDRPCQRSASCGLKALPSMLVAVPDNLTTIYGRLREAGYDGPIVTLAYYALDYRTGAARATARALDDLIVAAAAADPNAPIADGYAAFQAASTAANGDPCAAGLLAPLPASPTGCDIHPSSLGQDVLAHAFAAALATTT
jgi:lysophospholipase L1-like esterase